MTEAFIIMQIGDKLLVTFKSVRMVIIQSIGFEY